MSVTQKLTMTNIECCVKDCDIVFVYVCVSGLQYYVTYHPHFSFFVVLQFPKYGNKILQVKIRWVRNECQVSNINEVIKRQIRNRIINCMCVVSSSSLNVA